MEAATREDVKTENDSATQHLSGYLNLSSILKPAQKAERSLRLYPKIRFTELYHDFAEHKHKAFELPFIRKEWKAIIGMLDDINKTVWSIAVMRRNTNEWNKRKISMLHSIIFRLSLQIRDLHESLLAVITEEEVIWKNFLFNLNTSLKQEMKLTLTKDDIAELNPTAKISSLRLTLRQIFLPIENLIDSIESDLLNETVDEAKLRQFEDVMLIKVLPWFYKIFKRSVEVMG